MTGHVCIYNNPVLLSPGSAFHGLVTITRTLQPMSLRATLALTRHSTTWSRVTLSIYDNDGLTLLGAAFSGLGTVTGYTNVANNPSMLRRTAL